MQYAIAGAFIVGMALLLLLGVLIPRLEKRISSLKEETALLDQTKKQQEQKLIELTVKLNAATEKYDDTLEKIQEGQRIVNNLIEDGRTIAAKQLKQEFDAKHELLNHEYDDKRQALFTQLEQEKLNMEESLIPLKEELATLNQQKDATINALKREKELKNQQDYHRICLKEQDIQDIKYLREVLDRLSNRNVIAKIIYETYLATPVKEMLNRVVGDQKKTGIYRITDIETQECYVGQAVDIKARLTQHIKGSLGIQTIADQRIHHAMDERGVQNWYFEVLEECDKTKLNTAEKYWIQFYHSNDLGFNMTKGGSKNV